MSSRVSRLRRLSALPLIILLAVLPTVDSAAAALYLSPPSSLTAAAVSSSQINLTWIDSTTNETGFMIERALSSAGPWGQIATVGTSVTSYSNTGLNTSTTYYYRVRAYKKQRKSLYYSLYSNIASAATASALLANTATPTASSTNTPIATATNTPTRTNTPVPTATNTAPPTATSTNTPTPVPVAGWSLVSTGGILGSYAELYGCWTSGPSDVWVALYDGGGKLMHFDGATWTVTPPLAVGIPNAVWGSSATDIWAVGGAAGAGTTGFTIHWNGSSWSTVLTPLQSNWINPSIYGIWGTGSNNVWAVGPADANNYATALRWDGSSWKAIPKGGGWSLAAWGSSANDVWSVGSGSAIEHWNGSAWSLLQLGVMVLPNLHSVWGSASNDVWAVGYYNNTQTTQTIWHWNSVSWTTLSVGVNLRAVWGTGQNDVWAFGDGGTILHWDGNVWSIAASPTTQKLNGVCAAGGTAWAVGSLGTVLRNQAP